MDIDQLVAQSTHNVLRTGCLLCDPPDREGLGEYVTRMDEVEVTGEKPGMANRQQVFKTLKTVWNLPVGQATVNRHFNEHCER